jgi:flavin-dependent dehydrogenase
MRRTPALIVGGGPAGAAAAITLARGGVRAELIERREGPHDVVCGGFLGWDALAALERLGIDPFALGARPIERLRVTGGGRIVEAKLPRRTAGLSRRTLDEAMLAAASAAGAEVRRGRKVLSADLDTRTVRIGDGEEVEAQALFLATGKYELRGGARPETATAAVGLRTSIPAPAQLEGQIELHLFDGGYAGLLVQDDGSANLCLSVSRERFRNAGGVEALAGQLGLEAPALGPYLAQAAPASWAAVAGVPYGWRAADTLPGLFRIGDQGAVIASLAGDGIAIALESGMAAASAMLKGGAAAAPAFQRGFARRAARPLAVAETLRHAAEHPRPRAVLMRLLQMMPGLAPLAARLTRIG